MVVANLKIPTLGDAEATSSSVSKTNFAACSANDQCEVDKGDCDADTDCKGSLKCGVNNCPDTDDPLADCCYDPETDKDKPCDGSSSNMWTCCTDKIAAGVVGGCKAGEGDCDDDKECDGDLVCGRNSCDTDFNNKLNTKKFFPSRQADCCISKSRALFYGIPSRSDLVENFQNDDEPF